MKPIQILTHVDCESPGYIKLLLDRLNYPYQHTCLDEGIPISKNFDDVSAIISMGGPGNVNEPSEWMSQEIDLIKKADIHGIPVLGICLGAQLMSKALGGDVWEMEEMEIGWHDVELLHSEESKYLFADLPDRIEAFQWHAHAFSPPPGAHSIATSRCTTCQGYVYHQHLALQFHLEMDEEIIRKLIDKYKSDLGESAHCVQSRAQILKDITAKCEQAFNIADHLLVQWFKSVIHV